MTKPEDIEKRCYELIECQPDEIKRQLREFAKHRLDRLGLWTTTGQDLVQDAMLAILAGLQRGRTGRHPRAKDLADQVAFAGYLKGVINSLIEAEARRREHCFVHQSLDGLDSETTTEQQEIGLAAPVSPDDDVVFLDLRDVFFGHLKPICPDHLRRMVEAWEPVSGWTDDIPVEGFWRRHRVELRVLSKRVSGELGITLD